jgi:hypothetical protein
VAEDCVVLPPVSPAGTLTTCAGAAVAAAGAAAGVAGGLEVVPDVAATSSGDICCTNGSLLSNVSKDTSCVFVRSGTGSESPSDALAVGVTAAGDVAATTAASVPVVVDGCEELGEATGAAEDELPCSIFSVFGP